MSVSIRTRGHAPSYMGFSRLTGCSLSSSSSCIFIVAQCNFRISQSFGILEGVFGELSYGGIQELRDNVEFTPVRDYRRPGSNSAGKNPR